MEKKIRCFVILSLCSVFCCPAAKAQDRLYPGTFSLADVQLLPGPLLSARDLNVEVLLRYDVDRLLAPYLKQAGLIPKAPGYSNWDGLDGHIGGHYLSALAMNVGATGNMDCRARMLYMIKELMACQKANTVNHEEWGNGYVGGVPNSAAIWSGIKSGNLD